jgi:hypothetical protein
MRGSGREGCLMAQGGGWVPSALVCVWGEEKQRERRGELEWGNGEGERGSRGGREGERERERERGKESFRYSNP